MVNHPKRSVTAARAAAPSPAEVRAAREAAGLTLSEAALLVHASLNAWQGWEGSAGAGRTRDMHPAFWELFRIKTAQLSATRNAG